jgi:hypothetical protein
MKRRVLGPPLRQSVLLLGFLALQGSQHGLARREAGNPGFTFSVVQAALIRFTKMTRRFRFWRAEPATQLWRNPVTVLIGRRFWTILDGRDAAKFLTSNWPEGARQDPFYVTALRVCLAQLEGKGSSEDVRAAFVRAASAANVDVMDGSPFAAAI